MPSFASLEALVLLAAGLAACGGGPGDPQALAPSFSIRGVDVLLDTDAAFAKAPDFPSRLESTIDVSLRYWGGSWRALQGRSVTLVDDSGVRCRGTEALGCFDGDIRLTTRDPGIGTVACVEQTVLVHEIGHAVLGDRDHNDPRWMEMDPVAAELDGRTGYTSAGEAPCTTYLSVWRHPLGAP